MIQPDWTLIVSALVFLLTLWMLNAFLFTPLLRILDERRARTTDMQKGAFKTLESYEALLEQYRQRVKEGKQAGYRRAEAARKIALDERQARISQAREQAQELLNQAQQQIAREIQIAQERFRRDAEEIAGLIASKVLERTG